MAITFFLHWIRTTDLWTFVVKFYCCYYIKHFVDRVIYIALNAVTLLVGHHKEHLVFKNWVIMRFGILSEMQMIWIGPNCHNIIFRFIKIQNGSTFLVPTYPDCRRKEAVSWVLFVIGCSSSMLTMNVKSSYTATYCLAIQCRYCTKYSASDACSSAVLVLLL